MGVALRLSTVKLGLGEAKFIVEKNLFYCRSYFYRIRIDKTLDIPLSGQGFMSEVVFAVYHLWLAAFAECLLKIKFGLSHGPFNAHLFLLGIREEPCAHLT